VILLWLVELFVLLLLGLIGFVFYAVYGGSKTSLANAVEGQVFNFTYEQPLHGDT